MTYNFDPEQWYEIRLRVLQSKRERGDLSVDGYDSAVEELDRKYEEMVDRLDGSYVIPESPDSRS